MNAPRWFRRLLIAGAIRRAIHCGARYRVVRDREAIAAATEGETPPTLSDFVQGFWSAGVEVAPKPVAPPKGAGRQTIRMPNTGSPFGSAWDGPVMAHAHQAPYEDCHIYAKGARPMRDVFGYHGEPALSFVCPGCELEQPPIAEARRNCPYCGLAIRLIGTRLFWWRKPVEVAEWKP